MTRDTDLNLTETAGVQIFDITTTAAPRRKSARNPILEAYEFVPNDRVVAVSPDFQDYLDCCAFVAYSSLKCAGDNVKALRVDQNLTEQLAKLYKPGCNVDNFLDNFPKDERHALLQYLRCLRADSLTDYDFWTEDMLLNSIMSPDSMKPAFDIVHENSCTNKLKVTEISNLSAMRTWYRSALEVYDAQPLLQTEYVMWCTENRDIDDERITLVTSEQLLENAPTTGQHLVLASGVAQVNMCSIYDSGSSITTLKACYLRLF